MKAIRTIVSLMMLTAAIGCSEKKNDVDGSSKVGAGPTGRDVKIEQCQVGEVFNREFGCMSGNNRCAKGQGFSEIVGSCVNGKTVTEEIALGAKSSVRLFGRLKMDSSGRRRFAELLRDAKLCDSYRMYSNSNAGGDCQNYIRGGSFIVIDAVDLQTANVTIGAGTELPEDLLAEFLNPYALQNSINSFYIRFSQKAKAKSFNFDQGTLLISKPATAGLKIEIPKGNLGSDQMKATLSYDDVQIGTALIRRYD